MTTEKITVAEIGIQEISKTAKTGDTKITAPERARYLGD